MKKLSILVGVAVAGALFAQEPNPTQKNVSPPGGSDTPIFRVQVVSRSVQAVSYRNRSGWTKVDFQGTALAPRAKGNAQVNSRQGYLQVKTDMKDLPPAVTFGSEYLTYVLWAITPGWPRE